jgi:hypothetical protein
MHECQYRPKAKGNQCSRYTMENIKEEERKMESSIKIGQYHLK